MPPSSHTPTIDHQHGYNHPRRKSKSWPEVLLHAFRDDQREEKNLPPRYLRIVSSSDPLGKRRFELQTCIRTFEKQLPPTDDNPFQILDSTDNIFFGSMPQQTFSPAKEGLVSVDLHAQVHFADLDYFQLYNQERKFSDLYDRVHYELVAPDNLLVEDSKGRRRIKEKNALMPSSTDQQTALRYNLECQIDVIDYFQPNWICADYSREEFLKEQQNSKSNALFGRSLPGAEVLQALVRPSTPSSEGLKTRLFSNLFLPGEGIASLIRALLWIVPVPELSIILLDWSSLTPRAGGISLVASSVIESLITGDLGTARKLVFSQMIVSGQANNGASSFIIGQRNDRALDELRKSIERDGCTRNALVYGGLHCRDIQTKLEDDGFQCTNIQWRTAWTVDLAGGGGQDNRNRGNFAIGAIAVPLYLGISGVDWLATIHDIGQSVEDGQGIGALIAFILYIARHVALYLSLAKFVVEWDDSLFGLDGR
eukprot:CAMPEP_0195519556 /NCGR_PEP_ID=MMETSP0794_2-20130614/15045_1 /TAXON_ID=515487 /ORGANISM="Stephanopyxis turris, Strain CCMP 815" /LENGTH=481 /DNA_ID=CAMNT_0040648735 /DNA_START=248 /DNA_END=1693 /DNA_ORIENTATION=-